MDLLMDTTIAVDKKLMVPYYLRAWVLGVNGSQSVPSPPATRDFRIFLLIYYILKQKFPKYLLIKCM